MKDIWAKFSKMASLVIEKIIELNLLKESAALAFYGSLSLAPLLVCLINVLNFVNPSGVNKIVAEAYVIFGPQVAEVVFSIIKSIKSNPNFRSSSEIMGLLILIFSASSVFNQLRITISNIFSETIIKEEKSKREKLGDWIKQKATGFMLMMLFISITTASLTFSIINSQFIQGTKTLKMSLASQSLSFLVFSSIFMLLFYWIPKIKISKYNSIIGGLIAGILFTVGKYYVGKYLSGVGLRSIYGVVGSLMALLIWVYYSSFIFFVSGVITSLIPKFKEIIKK